MATKYFIVVGGGADSGIVSREASQLCAYMTDESADNPLFDFCFIQVGIVDCTPRLIPRKVDYIAKRLPACRDIVAWLNRKRWLARYFGRQWVNRSIFEKNVLHISKMASRLASKIWFIEIARPTHFFLQNCGDFSAAIEEYNAVFKKIPNGRYLPVFDDNSLRDQMLPDGHHLSKIGHRNIADKLIKQIAAEACV